MPIVLFYPQDQKVCAGGANGVARFPYVTYGAGALPALGQFAAKALESGLSAQPPDWFKNLPWSEITLASAFFLGGQFIADFRNRKSWLRELFERKTKFFDLIRGEKRLFGGGGERCLAIRAIATRSWSGVNISFRIVDSNRDVTLVYKRDVALLRGEEIIIPLWKIYGNGFSAGKWNPLGERQMEVLCNTKYLVKLTFSARFWPTQTRTVLLSVGDAASGASQEDVPYFVEDVDLFCG